MKVCKLGDLPLGTAVRVPSTPPVAVIRTDDDELFAIEDRCSHADAALSDGFIDGATIECPLHMAVFCLRTGAALSRPAKLPVQTYSVSVVDGDVLLGGPNG